MELMMKKGANGNGYGRSRKTIDSDGFYRQRSLVTIELDAFDADLYDRKAIQEISAQSPGFLGRPRQDLVEYHYVVTTRRDGSGGPWTVVVHHNGEDWTLPDAVLAAMRRHYDTIIERQRRDNGERAALNRQLMRAEAAQPEGSE